MATEETAMAISTGKPKVLKTYTEEQKQAFADRAAQIGLSPAMQELGYPDSKGTASRWCSQLGVSVHVSTLRAHSAKVREFYGHREKMHILETLLDKAYDMLLNGEPDPAKEIVTQDPMTGVVKVDYERVPCSAATINRLASTVQRTIQTIELIEGRVTERTEQIGQDATDVELAQMIRDFKVRNAVQEEQIRTDV